MAFPSTAPAPRLWLWLSSAIHRWPFWQGADPETVKQPASPADERAVADERSVRPERIIRGVVAYPQHAHAYFHCLCGQVSSETMWHALPVTGVASVPHSAGQTRCGTARVLMGGVRPHDKPHHHDEPTFSMGAIYLIVACAAALCLSLIHI